MGFFVGGPRLKGQSQKLYPLTTERAAPEERFVETDGWEIGMGKARDLGNDRGYRVGTARFGRRWGDRRGRLGLGGGGGVGGGEG
jgi:hypothetical protein